MADPLPGLIARLRFRHLRMLVELQRCGSLGKAAAALHLTQPALSKILQEVEQAFGFALYRRGPRGLQPTPQGEVVLQGAGVLLQELGHVHEAALASVEQPTSVLHLGAPSAVAAGVLPRVLAQLHAAAPQVLVRLREAPVPVLFDALAAGELDALVTSFNAAALGGQRAVRLAHEPCADHAYCVIARADHPLGRRRKLAWQELVAQAWILPEPGLLSRQGLDAHFLGAGMPVPQPAITSNHPATNVQLAAAGLGLAFVPEAAAAPEARNGRIVRLAVPTQSRHVPTALVYRAGTARHPVVRQLREAVAAVRQEIEGGAGKPPRSIVPAA